MRYLLLTLGGLMIVLCLVAETAYVYQVLKASHRNKRVECIISAIVTAFFSIYIVWSFLYILLDK